MTAIAGLWRYDGTGGIRPVAERMSATLAPYGPDRHGLHEDTASGIALMWRQMRVTAEDSFDRQPLEGGDGALWLVADARIDNGAELATELGLPVTGPDRVSDSGLILAAYQRWGAGCVDRLTGDFAFALWDRQAGQLLLARDFVGSRPLFFTQGPGFFAFASMPKGLLAIPDVSDALDEAEVGAYLALLPAHGTNTLYRDLKRVPPGHYMLVRGDRHELHRYWRPEEATPLPVGDYRDYVAEMRRLYSDGVRARLRTPMGTGIASHISAGFDSSSVTAIAAQLLAEQGRRLTAYTSSPRAGFPILFHRGRPTDESAIAATVAARYPNVDHRIVRTPPHNPLRGVERHLPLLEQPVLNPCNHQWLAGIESESSNSGDRVLLIGGMGNMTVSYDGMTHPAQLFRRGQWLRLAAVSIGMWRDGATFKTPFRAALAPHLPARVLQWIGAGAHNISIDNPLEHTALSPDYARDVGLDDIARDREWDLSYRPWGNGLAMRLAVLNRVDQGPNHHATLAAFGIDVRDPTCDRRLVDFCLTLPEQYFIEGGRRSSLFRDAMADLLPTEMLAQRTRGYQAADWYEGVVASRDDLAAELDRLAASPLASRALDIPRMRKLVDALPASVEAIDHVRMSDEDHITTTRLALMRGLSVGRFIRMVEGGNG